MATKNKEFSQVRRKIEQTIEQAEEERKRKLQAQRLEYARAGISAFKNRKLGEAARSFQSYLRILEELKGVPEGGLSPACFDLKKDQQELLMISGIYWDLVKLFDRTRSQAKRKEFLHYIQKYLLFSKGMPFQPLCAESVRKYISSDKPIHRSDFSNAYRVLSISKCFIVTSLLDVIHPDTLPRLQNLRDFTLKKSTLGRSFIAWYYRNGPDIANQIDKLPNWIRKIIGHILDRISSLIRYKDPRQSEKSPSDSHTLSRNRWPSE